MQQLYAAARNKILRSCIEGDETGTISAIKERRLASFLQARLHGKRANDIGIPAALFSKVAAEIGALSDDSAESTVAHDIIQALLLDQDP